MVQLLRFPMVSIVIYLFYLHCAHLAGGRSRVCEIFHTEVDAGTRAKRIKQEYGQGGAGWPLEGYGLHGYDTFHGQGIRFQWRDEEGEKEGYVSWKNIEKEIGVLIMTGEYQPETPRFEDIDMEGIREDDEVIDAEYRELDAVSDADGIDDFAIPDEPESYNSSLSDIEKLNRAYNEGRPLTEEEAAIEDRLATMAEYGPEMQMEEEYYEEPEEAPVEEATKKDASELQYIEPIDYAKRIEEMDEDLRTALEILVSECSCYTPFKPFLQDIVASEYLFMPKALFIKKYPSSLSDRFINEITSLPVHSITSIDVVPVPKDLTTKTLQKKYLGIESDIIKQQRVRNKNNDFSTEISYAKRTEKREIEAIMDDVRENDQCLFYVGVTIIVMAESKKELDSICETRLM